MSRRTFTGANLALNVLTALFLVCFSLGQQALAQTSNENPAPLGAPPPSPANEQKAEQIIERAVEALGGKSYLNVQSVTGRGYFTQFKDGISGLPISFVDYIIYPDRERTEFKGAGVKVIQTNVGDKGWLYDGEAKTLQDQTREQVEDFRFAMRTNIDYFLRGFWRKDGAKLSYIGRREAGLAKRNEAVKLTYADGLTVEFEFGARDGLPAKAIYKRKNKEGEEAQEEDRFGPFVTIDGVKMPNIIDHFRAGSQTSRINYDTVELNRPLADSLFTRPANIKAIK